MVATVLVTGALGQIGTELVDALRERHGASSVIATDIRNIAGHVLTESGPFEILSVLDSEAMAALVTRERIDVIYHLAAILSATGEQDPQLCERVNVGGTKVILEVARQLGCRVYLPSSIAVFGPDCPTIAPQVTALNPTTVYGRTKVCGEQLAMRYSTECGVDVRGLRYPGLISYKASAGGGTTDYAVEIFHAALEQGQYTCYVRADTRLPMMYMDDAIRATLELMAAPDEYLSSARGGYNIAGCSFAVSELVTSIQRHLPDFRCTYEPDVRQSYADSWPDEVEDDVARSDWGWAPRYDLDTLVDAMFSALKFD